MCFFMFSSIFVNKHKLAHTYLVVDTQNKNTVVNTIRFRPNPT